MALIVTLGEHHTVQRVLDYAHADPLLINDSSGVFGRIVLNGGNSEVKGQTFSEARRIQSIFAAYWHEG